MKLDEGIRYCEEIAKKQRENAKYFNDTGIEDLNPEINNCIECAKEFEQLAGWLTQLKQVQNIAEHWNDESSSFISACNAFEDILHIFKMGVGDMKGGAE